MRDRGAKACITVLAGTNGCGKSSIAGAMLRSAGGEYFNPDEVARTLLRKDPALTQRDANGHAWREGKRLLERAIRERLSFAFETTLGGETMTRLLEQALSAGLEVRVWYAGLSSSELHLARVRERVARGGHDIPETDVRRRYTRSLQNLVRLLPRLTELRVLDNSEEGDPNAGKAPRPRLLLHTKAGRIVAPGRSKIAATPDWAKPILAAALKGQTGPKRP
ncbi:MAG: AAA family ATPase [Polyangiaceae bacterium]